MGQHEIKLPDVGEGVAEAELVEWMVEEGQNVREDDVLAAVMTDKATVEIPSPVDGKIVWRGASIGDVLAVGSPIIRLEVDGDGNVSGDAPSSADADEKTVAIQQVETKAPAPVAQKAEPASTPSPALNGASSGKTIASGTARAARAEGESPLASPAVRARARNTGIDLRAVAGSGPAGRITHNDIDAVLEKGPGRAQSRGAALAPRTAISQVKVVGLRRRIAEKMKTAKSRIPHITYVDAIDVTSLEELRASLNKKRSDDQPKLTLLPFLMRALAKALEEYPQMNAIFDDEEGVIHQHAGLHMGVATQTPNGLIVPVVRHVESLGVWDCAREMARLAEAARDGSAKKEELSGSTITISSLGAMGGIVTTPVINHPEVAIIGVNKMQVQPVWDGQQFAPRKIMNLSSSFDHRVIDGWDCAVFIQHIKTLLESPAEIFID